MTPSFLVHLAMIVRSLAARPLHIYPQHELSIKCIYVVNKLVVQPYCRAIAEVR